MNLERAITFLAGVLVAVIVIMYAIAPQNIVAIHAFQPDTSLATGNLEATHEKTMVGEIADRQALAAYEATLPLYIAEPGGVAKAGHKTTEQIADLQELAAYQATLPIVWLEPD
jgi:hypothetical protein